MDRYSRGYDERYRGYYDRPRSDTYRPNESYRGPREYRDNGTGSSGSRSYSQSGHYYGMPQSPSHNGMNADSRSSSGSRGGDRYRKDHWYGYPDSRSHRSAHYSPGRAPSPPSYSSYYPRQGGPYDTRSPSPRRRHDSYDGRSPYHVSPPQSQYPPPPPSSSSSPPRSTYRSSSTSHYPYHRSSLDDDGSSGAPYPASSYSPHRPYRGPPRSSSYTSPSSSSPRESPSSARPSESHRSSISVQEHPIAPQPKPLETASHASSSTTSPSHQTPSMLPPSSHAYPTDSSVFQKHGGAPSSSPSSWTGSSYSSYPRHPYRHHHHASFQSSAPPSSSRHPPSYSSGTSPHSHHSYHPYHHNPSTPAYLTQPPRPRRSWAQEQEKEMERHQAEFRKSVSEEAQILAASRKSRFELELANWETNKLNHQLELVQRQWDESGLETLVREELKSNLAGKTIGSSSSRRRVGI